MRFKETKQKTTKDFSITEKEYIRKREKVKELELKKEDYDQESYGTRTK